jgi:hypothetical protein
MPKIDIRIEYRQPPETTGEEYEQLIARGIIEFSTWVQSAVVLRNNGFGHLLPDEATRQER